MPNHKDEVHTQLMQRFLWDRFKALCGQERFTIYTRTYESAASRARAVRSRGQSCAITKTHRRRRSSVDFRYCSLHWALGGGGTGARARFPRTAGPNCAWAGLCAWAGFCAWTEYCAWAGFCAWAGVFFLLLSLVEFVLCMRAMHTTKPRRRSIVEKRLLYSMPNVVHEGERELQPQYSQVFGVKKLGQRVVGKTAVVYTNARTAPCRGVMAVIPFLSTERKALSFRRRCQKRKSSLRPAADFCTFLSRAYICAALLRSDFAGPSYAAVSDWKLEQCRFFSVLLARRVTHEPSTYRGTFHGFSFSNLNTDSHSCGRPAQNWLLQFSRPPGVTSSQTNPFEAFFRVFEYPEARTRQRRQGQGKRNEVHVYLQCRTRQDKAGQGRTKQDKAGRGRTRQDKAGQGRTRQDKAGPVWKALEGLSRSLARRLRDSTRIEITPLYSSQ